NALTPNSLKMRVILKAENTPGAFDGLKRPRERVTLTETGGDTGVFHGSVKKDKNQRIDEFHDKFKSLIEKYFNGPRMALTTGLIVFYEVILIGAALLVFVGNPVKDSWRSLTAVGLLFVNTVVLVLAFAFALNELVMMDSRLMLTSLVTMPAMAGIFIYFGVFSLIQRRQNILEERLATLDEQFQAVYPFEPPDELINRISNARDKLQIASIHLGKGIRFIYRVEEPQSISEADLREVEAEMLKRVLADIDRRESRITTALTSAFDSPHLVRDQVQTIFNRLVREPNQKVLNKYIRRFRN
ncbi:hypothetical protein M1N56_06225, partial [Dehalococcoidia bacterium]|nr:hypothetical protein [Dehalococcoidia bacterium]